MLTGLPSFFLNVLLGAHADGADHVAALSDQNAFLRVAVDDDDKGQVNLAVDFFHAFQQNRNGMRNFVVRFLQDLFGERVRSAGSSDRGRSSFRSDRCGSPSGR